MENSGSDKSEKDNKSATSGNKDSASNSRMPSGPYPIIDVKSNKQKTKGRLSALRSSLRRDVEGIKSTIRRTRTSISGGETLQTDTKQLKQSRSKSTEHLPIDSDFNAVMPPARKNKKIKNKDKQVELGGGAVTITTTTTAAAAAAAEQQVKSNKSKAAQLVRRLSIGKPKSSQQLKEFDSNQLNSGAMASTSNQSTTNESEIEQQQSTNVVVAAAAAGSAATVSEQQPSVAIGANNTNQTLDDYLDQLTTGGDNNTVSVQSPIQIAIVASNNRGASTSASASTDGVTSEVSANISQSKTTCEVDKTESCDEDDPANDEHEDTEDRQTMTPYGDVIAGVDSPPSVDTSSPLPPSSMIEGGSDRREHLYKILVIGELGTGKTSIIKRYVHQFFSQHYRATIGVDFALKVLNWDANTIIRLQLWDIAGQERFGNMTRVYYKEAVGAFIVFDVTRMATFDAVVKWKQDLDSKVQLSDGTPIPCILLANKCDQQKEGLVNTPARMDDYCKEKGFAGWYETSAKENINIEEAARSLVNKILMNDKLIHGNETKKDSDVLALDGEKKNEKSTSGGKICAC